MAAYLANLNDAQRQAVIHPPDSALQILAGPGSGKTRVLTSRVAHLILHHEIPPEHICCVTFTNKAANEMKERLVKLVGIDRMKKLIMGTFHAICAKYLRIHGTRIGLKGNFSIIDTDMGKRIVGGIMRNMDGDMKAKNLQIKEGDVLSRISGLKAKGTTPLSAHTAGLAAKDEMKLFIAEVYAEYEEQLVQSNSLDFDDLLVYGVSLFKASPIILDNIRHILVDEFQDTNTMQYQLMMNFARASGAVSTVGDPDQSIYGWRAADVENLEKMRKEFPNTKQIFLEENYRSTASILSCSLAIVSQDVTRIDKGLRTSHPKGTLPVNRSFPGDIPEADYIANEVKRLIAYTGGMLTYNDFAVLLRYNALSRQIESSLQKQGIPSRVLAGQKFFDRLEVKDLLAYLQLVDNPQYAPGFLRIINVPRRALGDRTVEEIMKRAKEKNVSPMEVVEKIADRRWSDTKPSIRTKVRGFVDIIRALRKSAYEKASVSSLLERLLDMVKYEEWLRNSQNDWEMRWENVRELINFASQVDHEQGGSDSAPDFEDEGKIEDGNAFGTEYFARSSAENALAPSLDEDGQADVTDDLDINTAMTETPLRRFLETSMLATDTEESEKDTKDKVTIATCHAAKGLEWPVVFIPACEDGVFPFYRSENIDEECRLLYVACTRAQQFLYLTHTQKRMVLGKMKDVMKSEYLTQAIKSNRNLFTAGSPPVTYGECEMIGKMTGRPVPSREIVDEKIAEYLSSRPEWSRNPSSEGSSRDENSAPPQGGTSFTTGLGMHQGGSGPLSAPSRLTSKPFKTPSTYATPPLQARSINQIVNAQLSGVQPVASFQPYQSNTSSYSSYSGFSSAISGTSLTKPHQPTTFASFSDIKTEHQTQIPTSGITLAGGKKRLGMGFARPAGAKKPKSGL